MNETLIIFTFFDYLGTLVFAISGALAGARHRMDPVGIFVLAVSTACGGGILRDMMIGSTPVAFLKNPVYLLLSLGATVLVFFYSRKIFKIDRIIAILDAAGLATFLIIGTAKALALEVNFLGAILLGVVTAVAGGVIRDVLSNEVPLIFRQEIYATACVAGGVVYYFFYILGASNPLIFIASALTVFVIRLLAIFRNWSLPTPKL
ncbi:MAG: trimeric intracellular cation channel family protein [Proteobacteria bacterium]|nr:trimeric intracellular cation channel family protein [Pseudomonadota bacterium]